MVGNNYGMDSRRISRDLVSQNLRNINFLVIFSIFHFGGWGPIKVDDLVTSPINQFRDYFIRNRLEKLVPVINITSPRTSKTEKQIDQTVFKPWHLAEIWVSKNPGLVSGSPPGGLYFQKWPPKQNIFLEMPENIKNRYLLTKWLHFLCLFIVFFFPPPPIPIPTPA